MTDELVRGYRSRWHRLLVRIVIYSRLLAALLSVFAALVFVLALATMGYWVQVTAALVLTVFAVDDHRHREVRHTRLWWVLVALSVVAFVQLSSVAQLLTYWALAVGLVVWIVDFYTVDWIGGADMKTVLCSTVLYPLTPGVARTSAAPKTFVVVIWLAFVVTVGWWLYQRRDLDGIPFLVPWTLGVWSYLVVLLV